MFLVIAKSYMLASQKKSIINPTTWTNNIKKFYHLTPTFNPKLTYAFSLFASFPILFFIIYLTLWNCDNLKLTITCHFVALYHFISLTIMTLQLH